MPLPKRTKVSKEEFLAAIPGCCGTLQPIEKALNCTRKALRDCMAQHPDLRKELQDEVEREIDLIIISTIEDAKTGDDRIRCKARDQILKALAKDRGFGEKEEKTNSDPKIQLFLHTSEARLSIEDWQKQASEFSEQRKLDIDRQMKELGLSDE